MGTEQRATGARTRAAVPSEERDLHWLRTAVDLSRQCPRTDRAYAVGAVIVGADGLERSRGYSRELDSVVHAEEAALLKIDIGGMLLADATMYSSLEPCTARRSRAQTCTQLILAAGIRRVVFAWREPPLMVDCVGVELLTAAGVTVIEVPQLAAQARAVNAHLFA